MAAQTLVANVNLTLDHEHLSELVDQALLSADWALVAENESLREQLRDRHVPLALDRYKRWPHMFQPTQGGCCW